ncbi:hypothetical protein [Erwinia phage FBB1]|nr:hypothetical protein [Erwinia phage FBB1]
METKLHYIVYKTTNKINGFYYIGVHKTHNLNDGYLGSGKYLKSAISKYGKESFERTILHECCSSEEMYKLENEIVNAEYLKLPNVYNLKIGGEGQWNHINELPMTEERRKAISDGMKLAFKEGRWIPSKIGNCAFLGKSHSEESRKKISENNAMKINDAEYAKRIEIYNSIDFSKRGALGKFAEAIGVSHTQARRFINKI